MDLQKIDALVATIQEMQERVKNEGKALFAKAFKDFFAKHPLANKIKWRQYTPYFNDGEECKFSVHEPCLFVHLSQLDETTQEFLGEDECLWEGEDHGSKLEELEARSSYRDYPEGLRTELTEEETLMLEDYTALCRSLFRRELQDLFKSLFADHVVVTATASGITTDDCDHE